MSDIDFTKANVLEFVGEIKQAFKDYPNSDEAAARALLEAAARIYESRGRFTVVGQLKRNADLKLVDQATVDPAKDRVCLGLFTSEAKAKQALQGLADSFITKEECRVWVVPVFNGTPSAWYGQRAKEAEAELASVSELSQGDRLAIIHDNQWKLLDRCGKPVPDENFDLKKCKRPWNHPGVCLPKIPNY